ncbi:BTAD domain-containing putative transcriptional regulator [Nocardia sp. NBC_01327]|uniref:BTAD domain-containing putative transcriptional regulator n=1 Tax=Nocardia sp. NBC_01327 TaxID=2903593 RepID=UPI002E12034C|nr:AAA family ATPase [Nocardia sp. NBC_01327]
MAQPRVQVLGPIRLTVDDRPVGLGATMLRAVLARLVAAGGHAVTADQLIDDLWEGKPPPSAASVLQVHIHNLRRHFEPDRPRRAAARYVVNESLGYALKLDAEAVDAWHFEAQLRHYDQRLRDHADPPAPRERRELLDAALACWNGAPYEGLTLFGWAGREANRLSELQLATAERRAQVELDLGHPAEVAAELRALFDQHPEREECARLLATAQYRSGQQAQALATLRRTREYLGEEYGIDPGPALRELEIAILDHAEMLTPAVTSPPLLIKPVRKAPSYSGYRNERGTLLRVAAEVRGGHLQTIWVAGAPGAGKTTLAESVLAELAAQRWTTVRGGCPEVDGAPPAWAWSEIRAGLETEGAQPDLFATDDAFTIARTVVSACRQRTAAGPVLILLEDTHRADTATLQVLRQTVNWLRDEPVLILITLRGAEAGPGLHATAGALAHHTAAWLELTGLDLATTRAVARAAGLGALTDESLARLHRRTGGNPLFIREIAKLVAAQGSEVVLDEVPDTIRELINQRFGNLPDPVITALQQLAIWGEGVDLRILSRAAGVSEEELIDLIAAAESAGLVRTDRTGRITFDHALIQDTVYRRIPMLRRVRMHWAALQLLEESEDRYPGLARDPDMLAHHAILGAGPETASRAIEYVRAAIARSTERAMRADTVRLWQSAIELHELAGHTGDHAASGDRAMVLEAHCELVNALAYQGRLLDARGERQRAIALARRLDDRQLLIRAQTSWRVPNMWTLVEAGTPTPDLTEILGPVAMAELPRETQARLLLSIVLDTAVAARTGETWAAAERAVQLARAVDEPELLCWALNIQTFALLQGSPREPAEEILRIAEAAGLGEYRAVAHYSLYRAALCESDLRAAADHAALALEEATDGQLQQILDALGLFGFEAAMLRGDLPAARRAFEERFTRLAQRGLADAAGVLLLGEVSLAWAKGDLSGLIEPVTELFEVAPEIAAPVYTMALLHAGGRARARAVYDRYPRVFPYVWPTTFAVLRAHAAIEFGDSEEIRRLYEQLAGHSETIAGIETGLCLHLGPMDSTLADLAVALGNTKKAAIHRARAEALLLRMRADLAVIDLEVSRPRMTTSA